MVAVEENAVGPASENSVVPGVIRIPLKFMGFAETHGLASKAPSVRSSGPPGPWPRLTPSGSRLNIRMMRRTCFTMDIGITTRAPVGGLAAIRQRKTAGQICMAQWIMTQLMRLIL
jgi:hypothetical protein